MGTKLRLILYFINLAMIYLFASVQSGKLLFLEPILKEDIVINILKKSVIFFILLILLHVIVEILIPLRRKNKEDKKLYQRICIHIYEYLEKYLKTRKKKFNHNIRVTLFKKKTCIIKKVYIKVVGRQDVSEPKTKTKVVFLPGEGIAGNCLQNQSLTQKSLPDYCTEKDAYYAASEALNLSKEKVEKLNKKPCEIFCIPVKCYEGSTWGVLSIDSDKKGDVFNDEATARAVEEIIEHYKVFFEI